MIWTLKFLVGLEMCCVILTYISWSNMIDEAEKERAMSDE
jgi:hypothetical protein